MLSRQHEDWYRAIQNLSMDELFNLLSNEIDSYQKEYIPYS